MENEHGEPDRQLSESSGHPARDLATRSVLWLSKCGGVMAGYSAHAAEKAGSMFAAVGRVSVQALAKSAEARKVLLVRTSDLVKTKNTAAGERRLLDRVRLLQRDLTRLLRKKEAEVLALLRRKDDAQRGEAEIGQVEDAIRQREAEIARLSEELKTLHAQREEQRVSKDAIGETEAPAALPVAQPEPAAEQSSEPDLSDLPIDSGGELAPVLAAAEASTMDVAPVRADERVAVEEPLFRESMTEDDAKGGAVAQALEAALLLGSEEGQGASVEQLESAAEFAPAEAVMAPDEPGAAKRPELAQESVAHAPSPRPKRLSMEEIVQQAQFALASERVTFIGLIRGVETAGRLTENAAKKLSAIANPAVDQLFAVLAEHPNEATRAQSLSALAERQAKEALPIFGRAATDTSARVRAAALSGLYKLLGEKATPYLRRALKDEDPTVRHRVVMCLAWIGSRDVVPRLHESMRDDDASVRRAVVGALGTLKSESSIPRVIEALDDEDVNVREAAHRTLKELSRRNITFNAKGTLEERDKAKDRWKTWWKEQKASAENR